jgi:hypothetical protein
MAPVHGINPPRPVSVYQEREQARAPRGGAGRRHLPDGIHAPAQPVHRTAVGLFPGPQQHRLRRHALKARNKLLLVGPPKEEAGFGGERAAKRRQMFNAMTSPGGGGRCPGAIRAKVVRCVGPECASDLGLRAEVEKTDARNSTRDCRPAFEVSGVSETSTWIGKGSKSRCPTGPKLIDSSIASI